MAPGADRCQLDHGADCGQTRCSCRDLGFCGQVAAATAAAMAAGHGHLRGSWRSPSPVQPPGVARRVAPACGGGLPTVGEPLWVAPSCSCPVWPHGGRRWGGSRRHGSGWFSWLGCFLQAGLLVFGGGLVIIPLLQDQVVGLGWLGCGPIPGRRGHWPGVPQGRWCSPARLWAIKRVGLPGGGPTTATLGALVATAAIFLPSVVFILVGMPLLQRIRQNPAVQRFLAGVLAGVPGCCGRCRHPPHLGESSSGRAAHQPHLAGAVLYRPAAEPLAQAVPACAAGPGPGPGC